MNGSEPRIPVAAWWVLAGFLLAWNGAAARYAGPLTMTQVYDGTQYHLLARNRLNGHREVGDAAHTVRREGAHPIWRPGLILLEEHLAPLFGSVAAAAAAASALGTTLLQLAMLALAARHLGRLATLLLLGLFLLPTRANGLFLHLTVGLGPEPWAAALLTAGLAALLEAVRRSSWQWGLAAGALAGAAEGFRTGSFLVFLTPLAVLGLATLWSERRLRPLSPHATAFAAYAAAVLLAGRAVPSEVDKTAVNFGHRLIEHATPTVPLRVGEEIVQVSPGGLQLVPGTGEPYYDHLVRVNRGGHSLSYFREHQDAILAVYADGWRDLFRHGFRGLRFFTGNVLFACFVLQLLTGLRRRGPEDRAALALSAGVLAHYLGPMLLLRGDAPNHYLYVLLPGLYLASVHGVATLLGRLGESWQVSTNLQVRPRLLALTAVVFGFWAVAAHLRAVGDLRELAERGAREQADLDALGLEGRRVAVRNMSWFVDRDVETILFPYATADELERFAEVQQVDGLVYWENDPTYVMRMTPYDEGSPSADRAALERALASNPRFGPPQTSGGWHYFPFRPVSHASRP